MTPADRATSSRVEHGDLQTCPCLRHANDRRVRGIRPPPIVIGEHEFQVFAPITSGIVVVGPPRESEATA